MVNLISSFSLIIFNLENRIKITNPQYPFYLMHSNLRRLVLLLVFSLVPLFFLQNQKKSNLKDSFQNLNQFIPSFLRRII